MALGFGGDWNEGNAEHWKEELYYEQRQTRELSDKNRRLKAIIRDLLTGLDEHWITTGDGKAVLKRLDAEL